MAAGDKAGSGKRGTSTVWGLYDGGEEWVPISVNTRSGDSYYWNEATPLVDVSDWVVLCLDPQKNKAREDRKG